MTIDELKRALMEVREICKQQAQCGNCPFYIKKAHYCPIMDRPDDWWIDAWKDER